MRRATTNGEGWSRKKWGWLTTVLSFIVMGVGVAAWSYFQCEVPAGSDCLGDYPYREIFLPAMIFGGVMFVVGLVLLLISAKHLSPAACGDSNTPGGIHRPCIRL